MSVVEDVREYYSLGNSYHLSAHPMTCRAIGINPTVMRCHGNGMKVLSRPATTFKVNPNNYLHGRDSSLQSTTDSDQAMMGKDLELQVLGFFSFSFIFFLLWTFLFGHQEMELMSRPLTFGLQQHLDFRYYKSQKENNLVTPKEE